MKTGHHMMKHFLTASLLLAALAAPLAASAQTVAARLFALGGATNVNGSAHSAPGGAAGLRVAAGGGRLSFSADLSYTLWRDQLRRASNRQAETFNQAFKRAEFTPCVEVALSKWLSIGAGAYIGYLLRSKERVREYDAAGALTSDLTRLTTGLFNAYDTGLRLRLDVAIHEGWRFEVAVGQGFANTSVLSYLGVRAVPQSLMFGLEFTPPVPE
jgi:hypothetical protein